MNNVVARNRGCYTEAHPAEDEATRAMICKTITALLSEPGITVESVSEFLQIVVIKNHLIYSPSKTAIKYI
jgi:hypothetical protein